MNTTKKLCAILFIFIINLSFGLTKVLAQDSTSLNPQLLKQMTYVCNTTKTSKMTYRSAEWDCAHMDQAHSCNKNDVVTGLFSRRGWILGMVLPGWVCSYNCAHVQPKCKWV